MATVMSVYLLLGCACFAYVIAIELRLKRPHKAKFYTVYFDRERTNAHQVDGHSFDDVISGSYLSKLIYRYCEKEGISVESLTIGISMFSSEVSGAFDVKLVVKCAKPQYLGLVQELNVNHDYCVGKIR